jgi:hypothetical protein
MGKNRPPALGAQIERKIRLRHSDRMI